jgi:Family of unknown function (DUF5670)
MLETVAIILVVLWALGMVGGFSMGGLIHLLLVLAIVVALVRVIQGRRVIWAGPALKAGAGANLRRMPGVQGGSPIPSRSLPCAELRPPCCA